MKAVDTCITIAENYLRNCQFANAALAYETAVRCLYDSSDMSDLRALDDVSSISAEMAGMDGSPHEVAGLQSPIHDALVSVYGRKTLEGMDHFIGFKHLGTEHWVVSYHARKQLVLEGCSMPTGQPRVFTLVSTETGAAAWPVPDVAVARLSYLLAHIGWARFEELSLLYTQHQILDDSGVPALFLYGQLLLYRAIVLRPNYAWAWARLGETYRRIANGWPGSGDSLFDPESRVRNYVVALFYYQEALWLAPDAPGESWVRAHLGAAIVNARAFTGVVYKPPSPALDALLKAWFPHSDLEDAYQLFTVKARTELTLAMQRTGNYYPWAEDYYGATLLFESIITEDPGAAVDLNMLGFFNVVDALYLQPSMINSAFEPGELYVSPFLQSGLLAFWLRQFDRAWVFTRNGMGRLFKFRFLPGLEALQGFQILIDIAAEMLGNTSAATPERSDQAMRRPRILDLMNSELGPDFAVAGVKIPETPIADRQLLVDFIQLVMLKVGTQAIGLVMPVDVALNSTLQMSIVQAYFVFMNFRHILDDLGGDTTLVSKCMREVAGKLDIEFPETGDPAEHHRHNMFGVMITGKPTYKMAAHIKTLRRKCS